MKYIFSRKRGGGSVVAGGGVDSEGNGTALRLPKDLGSYSHILYSTYCTKNVCPVNKNRRTDFLLNVYERTNEAEDCRYTVEHWPRLASYAA
jgi:hypothetical protein